MQESGLTAIIPLICISAIWDQHLVFFHILSSLGLTRGSDCNLMGTLFLNSDAGFMPGDPVMIS